MFNPMMMGGMVPVPMMGGGMGAMTDKNGKPLPPAAMMQKYQSMIKKMQKQMKNGNFINPMLQQKARQQNFRGRLNTFHQKFTWRAPQQPTVEQTGTEGEAPNQKFTFQCSFQVDGETHQTEATNKNKKVAAREACKKMVSLVKKLGTKEAPEDVKAAMAAARKRKAERTLAETAQSANETNCLMLLSRLDQARSDVSVAFTDKRNGEMPDHTYTVTAKVTVAGTKYNESATSKKKKDAKRAAALVIVRKLGVAAFQQADTELAARPAKKAKTTESAPKTSMGMDVF